MTRVASPSPWTRACPACHLRNQRFLVLWRSGAVSPVCRRCFARAVWHPGRDPRGRFGHDERPLTTRLRALGHDREADHALRLFALSFLEDTREASDRDLSVLRLLEAGYDPDHPTRALPGAHGAASGGQRDSPGPLGRGANREPRQRPSP